MSNNTSMDAMITQNRSQRKNNHCGSSQQPIVADKFIALIHFLSTNASLSCHCRPWMKVLSMLIAFATFKTAENWFVGRQVPGVCIMDIAFICLLPRVSSSDGDETLHQRLQLTSVRAPNLRCLCLDLPDRIVRT